MREHTKLLLSVMLVGCTANVDEDIPVDPNLIAFAEMYSAFDGEHEYAVTPNVPSAVSATDADPDPALASSIEWHVDGAFVTQDEFPDLPAAIRLTTKKVGVTTVGVTARTLSGTAIRGEAKLTISRAKQSEWDAGETRYYEGESTPSVRPSESDPSGSCGFVLRIELPKRNSACHNCHGASSSVGLENTPTQIAGYSNEDLIKIFTEAAKPAGGVFKSPYLRAAPMPDCIYRDLHTWEMSDDEKNGIVWKLRSLAPKVQDISMTDE